LFNSGLVPEISRIAVYRSSRSGAGTELVNLRAVEVRNCQQQVRGGFLFSHDVAIAFQFAERAADQQGRRVAAVVKVSVTHAAAEVDQRVIEQRTVAVRSGLQLLPTNSASLTI